MTVVLTGALDAWIDVTLAAVFVEHCVVRARGIEKSQLAFTLAGIEVEVEVWWASLCLYTWFAPFLVELIVLANSRVLSRPFSIITSLEDVANFFFASVE